MDQTMIIWVVVGSLIVLLVASTVVKPLRFIGKACMKIVMGALFLFVLNIIGMKIQLHIPINALTASVTGLLGLPGVVALAIIQLYIMPH